MRWGSVKKEAETAKTGVKKKGGAAALRAQSSTLPNTPSELPSEPPTPLRHDKADIEASLPPTEEQAGSPVSTASSASEPPLSQRVRANGTNPRVSPPAPAPSTRQASPVPPTKPNPNVVPVVEIPTSSSSSSPSKSTWVCLFHIIVANIYSLAGRLLNGLLPQCRPCRQSIPVISSK